MPSSAGAIRAGRAFVEAFLDARQIEKDIKRLRVKLDAFAKQVGAIGKTFAIAGVALLTPLAVAVDRASDLQETMNKFDVVFADRKEEVKQWGDEFADQVRRSKKQVADFLASSQDLFVPLGFDPSATENLSKGLTGLAIDVASFNNKLDEDVLRDFHAALTGGGETVKKYGVIMNVAGEKAELLNMGINPSNATNAQKVMARYNILLRGTTAAQGDAVRSGDAWANQNKALWGALDDLAATVGTKLLPVITPYLIQLVDAVKETGEFAAQNEWLIIAVAGLGGALTVTGGGLLGLAAAAKVASIALGETVAVTRLLTALKGPLLGFLAVTAIVLFAREVYNANSAVQELNRSLEKSRQLNDALASRRNNQQQATLQEADRLQGSKRQQFLGGKLEEAQKNLEGMRASLKGQLALTKELEPTWWSLKQSGRAVFEEEKQNLEDLLERFKDQKQFVEELQRLQGQQQRELDTNGGRTDEQLEGIESILSRLNEELETFGLDTGQKAIRELEKLNANEEELAQARLKLAEISQKQAEAESRKSEEDARKAAQANAEQVAESLEDLADSLEDLLLSPIERAVAQQTRELEKLGATDEQLQLVDQAIRAQQAALNRGHQTIIPLNDAMEVGTRGALDAFLKSTQGAGSLEEQTARNTAEIADLQGKLLELARKTQREQSRDRTIVIGRPS